MVIRTYQASEKGLRVATSFAIAFVLLWSVANANAKQPSWDLRVCANEANMPYSNRRQEGFENRIAKLIADEVGAKLMYVWLPNPHHSEYEVLLLRKGACDVFMGVLGGQDALITTESYYRSSYVFLSREDTHVSVTSLDNPALSKFRIGVVNASPPDLALRKRGVIENVHHFSERQPLSSINDAVNAKKIDLGIVWGPIAGYFAKQTGHLKIINVTPEIDIPFLPMVLSISIGVREQDEALRDLLNRALVVRWDEIQAVLEEYGVPLLPLSQPSLGDGAP